MSAPALSEDLDETIDLQALLARIAAKRWWMISSVVLCTALFGAMAFRMPPIYRVATILAPASSERSAGLAGLGGSELGGLASLAGLNLGPRDADTEQALAVLRSREFTERFITEKSLMPKLFPKIWNAEAGTWKVDAEHRPTLAKAYRYFDKNIRLITVDKKTGLITLQIEWTDAAEAAAWANELVRRLNEEMRARAIAKADDSMEFLQSELQSTTTAEGRDAIGRLMVAQVKQRMLAHVTQDYSFQVVDRAISSDGEEPSNAKKVLLIIAGPLVGLILGVVCTLAFDSRVRRRT